MSRTPELGKHSRLGGRRMFVVLMETEKTQVCYNLNHMDIEIEHPHVTNHGKKIYMNHENVFVNNSRFLTKWCLEEVDSLRQIPQEDRGYLL